MAPGGDGSYDDGAGSAGVAGGDGYYGGDIAPGGVFISVTGNAGVVFAFSVVGVVAVAAVVVVVVVVIVIFVDYHSPSVSRGNRTRDLRKRARFSSYGLFLTAPFSETCQKNSKTYQVSTLHTWQIFVIFPHEKAVIFYLNPTSYSCSSSRADGAPTLLWNKNWRRKESRNSPCTSEARDPPSPAIMPWGKLKRLLCVVCLFLGPAQNDTRVAYTRGPRPVSQAL